MGNLLNYKLFIIVSIRIWFYVFVYDNITWDLHIIIFAKFIYLDDVYFFTSVTYINCVTAPQHHPPLAPREHRIPASSGSNAINSTTTTSSTPNSATPGNHHHHNNHSSSTSTATAAAGGAGSIGGMAVMDAFTQVSELLQEAHRQHSNLATAVEDLPSHGTGCLGRCWVHCVRFSFLMKMLGNRYEILLHFCFQAPESCALFSFHPCCNAFGLHNAYKTTWLEKNNP